MSEKSSFSRPIHGLRVDLFDGASSRERLPASVRRLVLGGRGLGAYILMAEGIYAVEPLSPENLLVFAPGPLTGSGFPGSGRYSLSSRSPLTGTVFDGNSGGDFGVAVRHLGLEYLVIGGACPQPSYLFVDEHGANLLPAQRLWGIDVEVSLDYLHDLHGRCEVAVIGPAGEHQVLLASISHDRGRQVGRGGLGAVMGSKLLKAIVLKPPHDSVPAIADKHAFDLVVSEIEAELHANPVTRQALPEFGTSVLLNLLDQLGLLPTRNYRQSRFESAECICGEALRAEFVEKRSMCSRCFIGCARGMALADGGSRGPEYESLWALGADCGISELGTIVRANHECNRLGLDTISLGATIACAMELTQEGALRTGPRFGDASVLLELISSTANRQGLGDELAEGSRRLAARYGRPELAMHVKGLELPAFDPRGMVGQGLAFATSNRGACHMRANMMGPEILGVPKLVDRFSTDGKAELLIRMQNLNAVLDSLLVCKFAAYALVENQFARLLSAVMGGVVEAAELLEVGERIWNLERLFNLEAGFSRNDDTLPPRLLMEPVAEGPTKGHVVDLAPMIEDYYGLRGWDADGVPTSQTLTRLGLATPPGKPTRETARGRSRDLAGVR